MDDEIMTLLSLESTLNLIYLASVLVLFGYGQRRVTLACVGTAIGIE